jgi:hypothetical protein
MTADDLRVVPTTEARDAPIGRLIPPSPQDGTDWAFPEMGDAV